MLRQKRRASLTVQMTQEETTLSKHCMTCEAKCSEVKEPLNLGFSVPQPYLLCMRR